MQNPNDPQRHVLRRWTTCAVGLIGSAVVVASQFPAVRDSLGIARKLIKSIESFAPTLGVAGIWGGFIAMVVGATLAWRSWRSPIVGVSRQVAVGSSVLAIALGGLVAGLASLGLPGATGSTAIASTPTHHKTPRHRRHKRHHQHVAHLAPKAPASVPAVPTTSGMNAPTPSPTTQSAPTSSSAAGSGGNDNKVTVTQSNHQEASTGPASGDHAESGDATNISSGGGVSISF